MKSKVKSSQKTAIKSILAAVERKRKKELKEFEKKEAETHKEQREVEAKLLKKFIENFPGVYKLIRKIGAEITLGYDQWRFPEERARTFWVRLGERSMGLDVFFEEGKIYDNDLEEYRHWEEVEVMELMANELNLKRFLSNLAEEEEAENKLKSLPAPEPEYSGTTIRFPEGYPVLGGPPIMLGHKTKGEWWPRPYLSFLTEGNYMIFPADVTAAFAYFVAYQGNENATGIEAATAAFRKFLNGFWENAEVPQLFSRGYLEVIINEATFSAIPEIFALNKIKPEFIDLGALARNTLYLVTEVAKKTEMYSQLSNNQENAKS